MLSLDFVYLCNYFMIVFFSMLLSISNCSWFRKLHVFGKKARCFAFIEIIGTFYQKSAEFRFPLRFVTTSLELCDCWWILRGISLEVFLFYCLIWRSMKDSTVISEILCNSAFVNCNCKLKMRSIKSWLIIV